MFILQVDKRTIYGYLNKRSKQKLKFFNRRWFFLISSKSLYKDNQDDKILPESSLPYWMKFDTIYYYKIKGKSEVSNQFSGSIKISECIEITQKDMVIGA